MDLEVKKAIIVEQFYKFFLGALRAGVAGLMGEVVLLSQGGLQFHRVVLWL